jgi:ABC-type sulfate transport system permease component
MLNPRKGTLIGIGAGVVVWLILFIPITALLVQPASNDIVILSAVESKHAVLSEDINQSVRNIALSAIVFHLLWGAIFGFITSSLVRASFQGSIWHRILGAKERKENTIK